MGASVKPIILKYYKKSLWLFILAKLQNKNLELENFCRIIKKAIIAKAKANLQFWAITKIID